MSARVPNPHERLARAAKVEALVRTIDRIASDKGVDPIRNPLEVVRRLKLMPPSWWLAVADRADVNPPSDPTPRGLTVRAVMGVYLARAGEFARSQRGTSAAPVATSEGVSP